MTNSSQAPPDPYDGLHPYPPDYLPHYFTTAHPGGSWNDYATWLHARPEGWKRLRRLMRGGPDALLFPDVPVPPLDVPVPPAFQNVPEWERVRGDDSDAVALWRLRLAGHNAAKRAGSTVPTVEEQAAIVARRVVNALTNGWHLRNDPNWSDEDRKLAEALRDSLDVDLAKRLRADIVAEAHAELKDADQAPVEFHTLDAVALSAKPVEWLIRGFWPADAFGQMAGPEKSLKSYVAQLMTLSVASGRPFLGCMDVRRRGPVVVYVGEGSADLWWRRAAHLAKGLGISEAELRRLPIHLTDQTARVKSERFRKSMTAALALSPVLVVVDPLYAFQGADVNAANLHEAGEVLNALSQPVHAAGAALVVVNHFTKAGKGKLELSSITMAGSREWAGAWCLMGHFAPPDLDRQVFSLELAVGSRQGNGSSWLLTIDLGPLDEETLTHQGTPSWDLVRQGAQVRVTARDAVLSYVASFALAGFTHRPSRKDVEDHVSATNGHLTRGDVRATLKAAIDGPNGPLVVRSGLHSEDDGRKFVTRQVVYLASESLNGM